MQLQELILILLRTDSNVTENLGGGMVHMRSARSQGALSAKWTSMLEGYIRV